ncbi:hypothetical protein MJM95_29165, partial [Salmonella enterica subsp. enterica serovar Anatum]|nr:hypothetical protein [Salmonella enterica subsp. enterica serovar Anatum]
MIGHSKGGYFYDSTTTAQTINWLRCKGQPLNDQHKPWFLAVNHIIKNSLSMNKIFYTKYFFSSLFMAIFALTIPVFSNLFYDKLV